MNYECELLAEALLPCALVRGHEGRCIRVDDDFLHADDLAGAKHQWLERRRWEERNDWLRLLQRQGVPTVLRGVGCDLPPPF